MEDVKVTNSRYVSYKLYSKNNRLLYDGNMVLCFYELNDNRDWFKMKLPIKCTEQNVNYVNFWIDLIIKIEPKIKIDKNYLIIPNMGYGKTLFILTAIRYLWEGSNRYDDIVIMTKNIIDIIPDIDPLKAILMANSCTEKTGGWGHSLVNTVVTDLKGVWHYRRYKGDTVFGLTNSGYGNYDLLRKFRKAKKDKFDVSPILKHFKYEKTEIN